MRTRSYRVSVRLGEQEMKHLNRQVKRSGLRREPYLRALITGTEIKEHPPEQWAEIVRQLSAIGNNINQIAHIANTTGHIRREDIDGIISMQGDIWRKVKGL